MLKPHEERVVQEHADLAENLGKLEQFLSSNFHAIDLDEAILLCEQGVIMAQYVAVLGRRIARFA